MVNPAPCGKMSRHRAANEFLLEPSVPAPPLCQHSGVFKTRERAAYLSVLLWTEGREAKRCDFRLAGVVWTVSKADLWKQYVQKTDRYSWGKTNPHSL